MKTAKQIRERKACFIGRYAFRSRQKLKHVKIGNREIGLESEPYIIAEIGVNYDNDMDYAHELIQAARRAGADIAKFQTYKASKIVAIDSPKYWEDSRKEESQYEFFKRSNRFYHQETRVLANMCQDSGIDFMSTPFDLDSVELLQELGVPAFKVASADITNYPLLRKVARTQKPVLLSTGASSIGEIETATKIIEEEGNDQIVLLHCILAYPTPIEHANLRMIQSLRALFPQYEVGWSDHIIPGECIVAPTVAVALGATVIEKHFTTDRTRPGNDHFHSADEKLMKQMILNVRLARRSLGRYLKQPLPVEESARQNARRSIAASRRIAKGETLTEESLILLRPGTGLEPALINKIVGLPARREIEEGRLLKWDDILGS